MEEQDFISYEYATKTVKAQNQTRAMDLYESFGWEVSATSPAAVGSVTLSLKRDRKLKHRQELNKLERQAEELSAAIEKQNGAKTLGASVFGFTFGVFGALVLGGGMSLVMLVEGVPALACGIILGLLGIALCGVNYPIYKKIAEKKTKQLLPVIEGNEERLAGLLEKGNQLLRTDLI